MLIRFSKCNDSNSFLHANNDWLNVGVRCTTPYVNAIVKLRFKKSTIYNLQGKLYRSLVRIPFALDNLMFK